MAYTYSKYAVETSSQPTSYRILSGGSRITLSDLSHQVKCVLSFLVLLSAIFYSDLSLAEAEYSPEQWMSQQTIIRVCMSEGSNFGDQAGTMNIMSRFREMGFKGNFEIIYDGDMQDKIKTLFGLPEQIPAIYEDKAERQIFIEMHAYVDQLQHRTVTLANLGFGLGKGGNACDEAETLIEAENVRTGYSKAFIEFQPYRGKYYNTSIEMAGRENEIDVAGSGDQYYVYKAATFSDAMNYLNHHPVGVALLSSHPALATFIEGMNRQDFNLQFIYGRTLRFDEESSGDTLSSSSPSNILQTIAADRYAQLTGPDNFRKPLILVMLGNYKKEAERLNVLLMQDHWGEYEQPGAEAARAALRSMNLAENFFVADLSDPEAVSKIKSLKNGQILLLSFGRLPKVVFDGFYSHTGNNILPPVYEGAGSFSLLALSKAARFECADTDLGGLHRDPAMGWTAGFNQMTDASLKKSMQEVYDTEYGYCGSVYHPTDQYQGSYDFMAPWQKKSYQLMGELIIDAANPDSALSHYFVDLNAYALKPENDRILSALRVVVKELGFQGKNGGIR